MRYVAALVAFVVTYFVLTLAYGELAPRALGNFFRDRQAMLGFILFVVCLIAAGAAFALVG